MDKKYIKGTTESGFRYSIDPNVFRDFELIELIGSVDEGNPFALPKVVERILGEKQKENLYTFCKKRNGFVDIKVVSNILKEIFENASIKN